MKIKVIEEETLTGCEHWKKCHIYIISGTYTIATGASLKIDNGTKVLLLNDDTEPGQIVFEAGSKLRAGDIISYAVDDTTDDTESTEANNGGWVFNGTVNYNNDSENLSSFKIHEFMGSYLGSSNDSGMMINDMRTEEFCAEKLRFEYSDLALELDSSNIKINKFKTINCEYALEINNQSTLRVMMIFNVRATNFLSEALSNSILIDKGAHFIVVTTTAGSAIILVSEDLNVGGKSYTSTQSVSNGVCKLKGDLFIYPGNYDDSDSDEGDGDEGDE